MLKIPITQNMDLGSDTRNWRLLFLLIVLLGFFLRIHNLGERSLWFDEAHEYWIASGPIESIPSSLNKLVLDPPLFSFLLHYWMKLGRSEEFLRLLSVLFSILGMFGIIRFSSLAFDKNVALIAGLLIAFSVPDIRYAQEVGQYGPMMGVLSWQFVFLWQALNVNTWKYWGFWTFSALAAIYLHYGSAVIIVAVLLVTFIVTVIQKQGKIVARLVLYSLVCLIFVLPLLTEMLPYQYSRSTSYEFDETETELTNFLSRSRSLIRFYFVGYQPHSWPWDHLSRRLLYVPVGLALLFTTLVFKRNWLVMIWFWGSYILLHGAGRIGLYPFDLRYALNILPLVIVILAVGIEAMRRFNKTLGTVTLCLLLAISIFAPPESQQDLRTITTYWHERVQPDDYTYIYYAAGPGFRYQLDRIQGIHSTLPPTWFLDCWVKKDIPYCFDNKIVYGHYQRHWNPGARKDWLFQTIGQNPQRLWLLSSHIYQNEDRELLEVLLSKDHYSLQDQCGASNASAFLVEKRTLAHIQATPK